MVTFLYAMKLKGLQAGRVPAYKVRGRSLD